MKTLKAGIVRVLGLIAENKGIAAIDGEKEYCHGNLHLATSDTDPEWILFPNGVGVTNYSIINKVIDISEHEIIGGVMYFSKATADAAAVLLEGLVNKYEEG